MFDRLLIFIYTPMQICFRYWHLTISVSGRARGPVCGCLVFWFQVAIEPFALFYRCLFDYMCFTVIYR